MGNACYYSVEKLLSSSLLSKNLKVRIYKTVILPVVLYGCETWTLTLREEHRLRVFENKVLRKIFGAKRDEVTGEWRKLHNAELHALCSSPDIIRNSKSRCLRWAGHVAHLGESRNAYRVLVGRPEGKRPLGTETFDCPREWPELVPTLLTAVKSEDPLIQHRALLMLHHVIKTLSSKRLAGDRRLFQELTGNVFSFVLNLWNSHVENFLAQVNTNNNEMGATLEKALLALRILRKLTVHGFKKPHESTDAVHFLNMVFDRAKTMLECRKSLRSRGTNLLELCEKFIIHLTKVLIAVLEHHPFSYVDLIQPSLEFAVYYVFTPSGETLLFERFIIQCLNLIKGILLCAEYKPAKVIEETKEPGTLRAHQIKMSFFTANTLTEMCRKLVTHYFLLTRDDLELWDSDPESFGLYDWSKCNIQGIIVSFTSIEKHEEVVTNLNPQRFASLKTVPGTRSVHCVLPVNGKLAIKPYSASSEVPILVGIRRVTLTGRQCGNASRSDQQQ
ncbi:hypothetical protein ANN_17641 [Periplaneta americana]|uniref:Uncharacterized protein n=1 Tax=Periplaneta americana TaxID=6978 RepID=A0ABQ8SUQ7_PERAM|nr:hypothetical protein ANN_17641 [Periplaneta americana]